MTDILNEARRLYKLGLGVHWLRPKSKIPRKKGWEGPRRDDWKTLLADYQEGFGLGIRLGEASRVDGKYLTVIDVDLRSEDPRYLKEAMVLLESEASGLFATAACVHTGRGFGSCHLYFLSNEPVKSRKMGRSPEQVKVYSPSSKISGQQIIAVKEGRLTRQELSRGLRLKCAWEVELMGNGKQVVAPPTIHLDTQKRYSWKRPLL